MLQRPQQSPKQLPQKHSTEVGSYTEMSEPTASKQQEGPGNMGMCESGGELRREKVFFSLSALKQKQNGKRKQEIWNGNRDWISEDTVYNALFILLLYISSCHCCCRSLGSMIKSINEKLHSKLSCNFFKLSI